MGYPCEMDFAKNGRESLRSKDGECENKFESSDYDVQLRSDNAIDRATSQLSQYH